MRVAQYGVCWWLGKLWHQGICNHNCDTSLPLHIRVIPTLWFIRSLEPLFNQTIFFHCASIYICCVRTQWSTKSTALNHYFLHTHGIASSHHIRPYFTNCDIFQKWKFAHSFSSLSKWSTMIKQGYGQFACKQNRIKEILCVSHFFVDVNMYINMLASLSSTTKERLPARFAV